jgi:Tfp pilus assembly protein PilO
MNKYLYYIRPYLREPKKKAYTMVGLTLLALSVFGAFAIRPALGTVFALRKEVEDLRDIDQRLTEKLTKLAVAQAKYNQVKSKLYLLDIAIPDQPEPSGILTDINSHASSSGVVIRNINFSGKPSEKDGLNTFAASVDLSGDFDQVIEFLNLLENNLYEISPARLSLNLRTERTDISTLGVKLDIETYYYAKPDSP